MLKIVTLCDNLDHILVVTNSLICNEGYDVSFECPCPGELNECRFKKLFQGGYIVRNGILNAQLIKFEFNDKRTHITLKECHEEDEGTYIWMCGRCNVNKELHLEVQKVSGKEFLHIYNTYF